MQCVYCASQFLVKRVVATVAAPRPNPSRSLLHRPVAVVVATATRTQTTYLPSFPAQLLGLYAGRTPIRGRPRPFYVLLLALQQ